MIRITVPGEAIALLFLVLILGFTALVLWPIKALADRAIDRHFDRRRAELAERIERETEADQEGDA